MCTVAGADSQQGELEQIDGDDVLPLSGGTTLKPVRFWSEPNKSNALEPGIKLLDSSHVVPEDEDSLLKSKKESQRAVSATQVSIHFYFYFYFRPNMVSIFRNVVSTFPLIPNITHS